MVNPAIARVFNGFGRELTLRSPYSGRLCSVNDFDYTDFEQGQSPQGIWAYSAENVRRRAAGIESEPVLAIVLGGILCTGRISKVRNSADIQRKRHAGQVSGAR